MDWPCPAAVPPLATDQVHVWRVPLALDAGELAAARALLSPAEIARADRYIPERARRDSIGCRAALRLLLGTYLDTEPVALRFVEGEFGKPALAGESSLQFNVSHADPWALIAVTLRRRVGVDIERRRPISNLDGLAEICFSPRELASYQSFSGRARAVAFFNAWTRKEAFIKATGRGLTFPLQDFDVSLTPGEPAKLLRAEGELAPARWSLWGLDPAPGFAGAVIVDEPGVNLTCLRMPTILDFRRRS